jgi:HEAT repeat protein
MAVYFALSCFLTGLLVLSRFEAIGFAKSADTEPAKTAPTPKKPTPIPEPTRRDKTVRQLIKALEDKSYWPDQYRAAKALSDFGPWAKEAVPALGTALKDEEPFVRMAAAETLGSLAATVNDREKCERFVPEALRLLLTVEPGGQVALDAARRKRTQGIFGGEPRSLSEDEASWEAAWKTIGEEGVKKTTENIRRAASQVLQSIRKDAVPSLAAALKDPEWCVREAAARALGNVGTSTEEVVAALQLAKNDKNESVRRAASEALATIGPANTDLISESAKKRN